MKVLVIGSGGREHCLAWKLKQSQEVSQLFCAPGNGGMAQLARCVPISVTDRAGLVKLARQENIDLTVVGPELPLVEGVADAFAQAGLNLIGPSAKAARLEGSKIFAKRLAENKGIPSADFAVFSTAEAALAHLKEREYPAVIKADGLAGGKGVMVVHDYPEAERAVAAAMVEKRFGPAGDAVIVEDFLAGEEASFIGLVDGTTILPLASSQDHKPIGDGDTGPNTGGMGAYSPAPIVSQGLNRKIIKEIIEPAVEGLREQGINYRGVIYAGLMIVKEQPYLLEFNVRFGDPETQPIIMRLNADLALILSALSQGKLHQVKVEWDERSSVCVVMTSAGYPGSYSKGMAIQGLEQAASLPDVQVFHAGTRLTEKGIVTDGGRVLGVSALGKGLKEAVDGAYAAVDKIHWEGAYCRRDIGWRGLAHEVNS
jgi:phosphoribosylamine--glycine ligase